MMNNVTLIFILCFFSECDVDYICPSEYHPPDENSSDSVKIKNGLNEEDPYERIVRGNLQLIEKQKVKPSYDVTHNHHYYGLYDMTCYFSNDLFLALHSNK
jgi:hypothetical protein